MSVETAVHLLTVESNCCWLLKIAAYVRPRGGTGPTPTGRAWWDSISLTPAVAIATADELLSADLLPPSSLFSPFRHLETTT